MSEPLVIRFNIFQQPDIARMLKLSPAAARHPLVQNAIHQAGKILYQYELRRFLALSSGGGGGQWPPLSEERKRKKKNPNLIMRESDTLLSRLEYKRYREGVMVGFIRNRSHPDSKLTVLRLAHIHHGGSGNIPARPLIIDPPQRVIDRMVKVVIDAITKVTEQSQRARPTPPPINTRLRALPPNARSLPRRRR